MEIFFIITDEIPSIDYFLIFTKIFDRHCSSKKKKNKKRREEDKENNSLDRIDW